VTSNRADRRISVLSPLAEATYRPETRPIAPRLRDLAGATIGLIDNSFDSTGHVHAELRASLIERGASVVAVRKKYWRRLEPAVVEETAGRVDAIVSGVCTTPPSTTWGVIDSIGLERLGTPTVTLVADYYEPLLAETAAGEGMPGIRYALLPYPIEGTAADEVRAAARAVLPQVVAGLVDEPSGDDSG
jgi:hypothetical protein